MERDFADQAARMVFITGGATSPDARNFVEAHADRVIRKPFTPQNIEDALRYIVNDESPSR